MFPHICSSDVSFEDHDKDMNQDHDSHVVRVLISVLKDLSASCIDELVHVYDINSNHKLPECYSSVEVFARFFFLDQREQTLEIINFFNRA